MFDTEVLVIGGGAAGIRAAVAASQAGARVMLLDESPPAWGGSTFSNISGGWGIQALVQDERTDEAMDAFFQDIVRVGLGMCDPQLAGLLVEESGPRFEDLLSYGMRFRMGQDGGHLRAKGCFSTYERAFLTEHMDNVKLSLMSTLQRYVMKTIRAYAIELTVEDGSCWGVHAITPNNELICIRAKATVIASGGGAGIFEDHLVFDRQVGGGYALASRAGAQINNLEFIQFMLGLKNGSRRFLPLHQLSQPSMMQGSDGRDILDNAFANEEERSRAVEERMAHMPFSSRDSSCKIDLAVAGVRETGEKVLWNGAVSHGCEPFEVVHLAHAFNGGIRIDENAESTLPGLFAAGEVAAGPHGADRIGGCMMTATQVFGKRAGDSAAKRAMSLRHSVFPDSRITVDVEWAARNLKSILKRSAEPMAAQIRKAMGKHAMLLRCEHGLAECIEQLSRCESFLEAQRLRGDIAPLEYFRTRAMTLVGRMAAESAVRRKQSLGSHCRVDLPGTTDVAEPRLPGEN